MEIVKTIQYRHRRNPERKVRITDIRESGSGVRSVSFAVYDPGDGGVAWLSSESLGDDLFAATYEPDVPDGMVLISHSSDIYERASAMMAELIADVEARCAPEVVALRARIARVLEYLDNVREPNTHTLWHVRRILTEDQ